MDETRNDSAATREVLLTFYTENASQSRSYEQQRQTVTTTVVIAAAIVIGLAAFAPPGSRTDLIAGLFLVVLGGHGFLACLRHYERGRLHVERVHAVRKEISKTVPVLDLYAEANAKHSSRFPVLSEKTARTNLIWLGLHAAVAGLGVLRILL